MWRWKLLSIIIFWWGPLCLASVDKGGDIALPLSAHTVLWVCLPFISLQRLLSRRRSNTKHWPNAGLMLANPLRRWPNISPVIGCSLVAKWHFLTQACFVVWTKFYDWFSFYGMPWAGISRVPSSMTLFQHWTNIVQGIEFPVFPAKMRPLANAVLQLSHGRRR